MTNRPRTLSIDGGRTWTDIKNTLLKDGVLTLVVDSSDTRVIYAGTKSGILQSSDGGGTWRAAKAGLPALSCQPLAIDPADHDLVYIGTRGAGVFKRSFARP